MTRARFDPETRSLMLAAAALAVFTTAACSRGSTNPAIVVDASAAGAASPASPGLAVPPAPVSPLAAVPIALPSGAPGIGFDDMRFAPALGRVLVPAGRSGQLFAVDPATRAVEAIGGFSASPKFEGGHDFGVTSADEGRGLLFATDRSSHRLDVVAVERRAIVASARLGADPDYVRFVAPKSEVWVTEPDAETIEIFSVGEGAAPTPVHAGAIAVRGGPESLVVDAPRGRAYTHLWHGETVAIDIASRSIAARWPNGCEGSRGIDIDERGAFVFAGCAEGKAVAIETRTGKIVSQAPAGKGVDVIAYASGPRHLYAQGASSATLTIVAVGASGELRQLATVRTAAGGHCAASDPAGHVLVCDPARGGLLAIDDSVNVTR